MGECRKPNERNVTPAPPRLLRCPSFKHKIKAQATTSQASVLRAKVNHSSVVLADGTECTSNPKAQRHWWSELQNPSSKYKFNIQNDPDSNRRGSAENSTQDKCRTRSPRFLLRPSFKHNINAQPTTTRARVLRVIKGAHSSVMI